MMWGRGQTHKPFHQCHALLNYHQQVSGAICKWPLPIPDGDKSLLVLMLTNRISMSTELPKVDERDKETKWGTEMSKE